LDTLDPLTTLLTTRKIEGKGTAVNLSLKPLHTQNIFCFFLPRFSKVFADKVLAEGAGIGGVRENFTTDGLNQEGRVCFFASVVLTKFVFGTSW
jgi:hypothetical protein